ncbi:unnamed protein product [Closterium sp. Naga37s-1]|nr:unnamed protein product [Closterium sp. Naga37s-1]
MSPYEIGLINRLSSSARDTFARPPQATAQSPDGHIPRQPPDAPQSAETPTAPSGASAMEAVVVCREGEPFTVVAQASFRAPFRVEMRVAGQSLGYTEYFYSPGEINLHWFQGWHLGQGQFAPFTCDPAMPRDAGVESEARANCSAGIAPLKPAQMLPRKSRGLWPQGCAAGEKESSTSRGSRRKAVGGTRGMQSGGRRGTGGAHGGDTGKGSGRRHAGVAGAWWCCSSAHSAVVKMTAPTTGARGGMERRRKLHWRGGHRAPQPQQKQQWQGNEKQGNGEQAAAEVVRAEQEREELDGCGWRDERAGLPIPSALALSFDPCSNALDTSSSDGTDSLSSPPSSPPSSPFHPRHVPTGAKQAEVDVELGAVGGECSAGEQQAGAACRVQCLPASFSHPCTLSSLTQSALHPSAPCDAADAPTRTDDEDGDESSNADHEDAASSSSDSDTAEDDPDGSTVPYRSCLPPLLSLWPRYKLPPQHRSVPPVLPSDLPSLTPSTHPLVVDFRVDVLFQSIRLLPCTALTTHVTSSNPTDGPTHTNAQCEHCEKRLRWYLGEVASGPAAPVAASGATGAHAEQAGGGGEERGADGGGGTSVLDVPGPVPFHYEDLDQQAEAGGGGGRFGGGRNRERAEAQRGARGGGRRAQGRAVTAEEEALQSLLEDLSAIFRPVPSPPPHPPFRPVLTCSLPPPALASTFTPLQSPPTPVMPIHNFPTFPHLSPLPPAPFLLRGWQEEAGRAAATRQHSSTDHFEASLRYYHTALSSPALTPAARLSVLFDMGEAYLGLGEAQLADGKRAVGGPMSQPVLTWQVVKRLEREAATSAADSSRLAFEAFDEICRVGRTLLSAADSSGGAQSAADVSSGGGGRGGRGRGGGEGGGNADVAEMVQGAAVNAANALVAWAEAVGEVEEGEEEKEEKRGDGACEGMAVDGGEQQQAQAQQQQERARQGGVTAAQLLREAAARYDAAAATAPSDTDLLSNLGDCAVKTTELLCPERPVGEGAVAAWGQAWGQYERGMGAYGAACSLCDARVGDDLPGLLHNWGVGLLSAAQRCPEPDQEVRLLTEAAEKLQRAADFQPTDIASRLALGEVLSAQGEVLSAQRAESALPSATLQEALHLLSLSLSRGFSAALRIDSRHPEALLGAADVHLSAARLLMGRAAGRERGGGGGRRESGGEGMGGGDEVAASLPQEAVDHLQHAMSAYRAAMVAMKATDVMSYADQCSGLYNMACAAALAGLLAESADILARLAAIGWLSKGDLLSDEDFRFLRQSPVYTCLLSGLTVQESL